MEHALLKGLLECECCNSAMGSTKSNKKIKFMNITHLFMLLKKDLKSVRLVLFLRRN